MNYLPEELLVEILIYLNYADIENVGKIVKIPYKSYYNRKYPRFQEGLRALKKENPI